MLPLSIHTLRRALRLSAALWLFGTGCAGPQREAPRSLAPVVAASEPEMRAEQATPGLFLYAVHGPNGTSHLLGTMHVGFGFEEVLTDDARARFRQAERVLLEADVSSADPGLMQARALLPDGQSLRLLLGEPSWNLLVERLGSHIPPPFMERLKPWLPAVTLGLLDLEGALQELKPDARNHMMDLEVMAVARAEKKQLMFLETIDEQLAMFDQVPLDEQIGELRRSLSDGSSHQGRTMLRAFAEGDEEALAQSLFEPEQVAQAPGFFDVVLNQRNTRWLPVLEQEIARGRAFVAVGAAHLLGERGILAQLRERGYVVTRVGVPPAPPPRPLPGVAPSSG